MNDPVKPPAVNAAKSSAMGYLRVGYDDNVFAIDYPSDEDDQLLSQRFFVNQAPELLISSAWFSAHPWLKTHNLFRRFTFQDRDVIR
jgi:hypothetical protein